MQQRKAFPILETEKFILRRLQARDLNGVYALYTDPGVIRFDGGRFMEDKKEAEQYIYTFSNRKYSPESIRWAVILKETNQFIGTCGFQNWDFDSHRAEIGGDLSRRYWRKGYSTEVLSTLIPFAFHKMKLNRISALTLPENTAVIKLLTKFHFVKEGVLREYQTWKNGYADLVMYSLLKKEYLPPSRAASQLY